MRNRDKKKAEFPKDCPHKNFFGCKTPKDCPTCFYNPDIKQKPIWFYDDEEDAQRTLQTLDDIRKGKGLRPGGKRCRWKYIRKKSLDDE